MEALALLGLVIESVPSLLHHQAIVVRPHVLALVQVVDKVRVNGSGPPAVLLEEESALLDPEPAVLSPERNHAVAVAVRVRR